MVTNTKRSVQERKVMNDNKTHTGLQHCNGRLQWSPNVEKLSCPSVQRYGIGTGNCIFAKNDPGSWLSN